MSEKRVQILKKPSHLYLNGKNIKEIKNIKFDSKLRVLYLHNNKISTICNLNNLENLTFLYLQWNNISKIENLNCLKSLKKLYLGHNNISHLENLENLSNLEELYIERQNLKPSEIFTFDTKSIEGLSKSLYILNISNLNLSDISKLAALTNLKVLLGSGNRFEGSKKLASTLQKMKSLEEADLTGCPAQKEIRYRDNITMAGHNLTYLDGKIITQDNRAFIKIFHRLGKNKYTKVETSCLLPNITTNFAPTSVRITKPTYLSTSSNEMGYQTWNSLNSIKKTKRSSVRKNETLKLVAEYPLQGKNIH